jgi:hypothetical protein
VSVCALVCELCEYVGVYVVGVCVCMHV